MGLVSDQASGIATVIETVALAGNVFPTFPRPLGEWSKFVDLFKSTAGGQSEVRAWIVTYLGEERERRTIAAIGAQGKVKRRTSWLVRGFLGWNDPNTDEAFRDLAESIANAIDLDRRLGGTADDHTAVTIRIPNEGAGVVLGDILCHAGELRFTADKDVLIA